MTKPTFLLEQTFTQKGFSLIAGVDEAGRGPLAGPVVAAAVILGTDCHISGLNDSKKLSPKRRAKLFSEIRSKAVCLATGIVGHKEIDRINIQNATFLAMKKAINKLKRFPDLVLVDGNRLIPELGTEQKAIIKGDSSCCSIAAASIIAKVVRDWLMQNVHKKHPGYGFDRHKGYGTKQHISAMIEKGITPFHRVSFHPVKALAQHHDK